MKSAFIFTVSIFSFLFSPLVNGKTLTVFSPGKSDFVLRWNPNWFFKMVDSVICYADSNDADIEVYYRGVNIGTCGHNRQTVLRLGDSLTGSGGIFSATVRNNSNSRVTVGLIPFDHAGTGSSMGNEVVSQVPAGNNIELSLPDSIDFGTVKSGGTERKILVSNIIGASPGIITVKPSVSDNGKGVVQNKQKSASISYTVDGGKWNDKVGGWVLNDGLQHDLIINQDKLTLIPGHYEGYVTVTLASE